MKLKIRLPRRGTTRRFGLNREEFDEILVENEIFYACVSVGFFDVPDVCSACARVFTHENHESKRGYRAEAVRARNV